GAACGGVDRLSLHDALPIVGACGDVEGRVQESVDGTVGMHHRLADVDQLGGLFPDYVDSQETTVLGGQHQLDHAVGRTDDVAAGDRKSTRLNSSHVKSSYAV